MFRQFFLHSQQGENLHNANLTADLDPESDRDGPIRITVDDREESSGVLDALRSMDGVEIRVQPLRLGDYLIDELYLFERQSLPDFAASLKDGRLFSQAKRLAGWDPKAAIILEGRPSSLDGSSMRREALLGAIVSLSLVFELPVLRSAEPSETARLLVYAARQLRREQAGAVPRHGRRPKGKRKVQLRILQGLPQVGPKKAQDLLECFGNVQSVMIADCDELMAVRGIGEKAAQAIRWALS